MFAQWVCDGCASVEWIIMELYRNSCNVICVRFLYTCIRIYVHLCGEYVENTHVQKWKLHNCVWIHAICIYVYTYKCVSIFVLEYSAHLNKWR